MLTITQNGYLAFAKKTYIWKLQYKDIKDIIIVMLLVINDKH